MCCESVRASASLHKDHLVVLARRFFAHAHSWEIRVVVVFIHINSMLSHKTHANANDISTILILIMTITWVVPGHDEPLPILTRSLRRRCVARPGGFVVITYIGFHTHILVFIHIGYYTYWLSYLVITTHIGYHTYWLSHKGIFISMGSWPIIHSPPLPRRKRL